MESGIKTWVLLLSQFTHEALFFESLAILFLCAVYSAYWVIRKRRLGPDGQTVSTGVVKGYLNQLIGDAELLRTQLFGLLAETGGVAGRSVVNAMPAFDSAGPAVGAAPGPIADSIASQVTDPQLALRIADLERKLQEQTNATNQIVTEKAKLEKDLAAAKAKGGTGAGDAKETEDLKRKVKDLEGRLAEYNVIEDDLANLKRLQQENIQLRTQIGGGAVAAVAAVADVAMDAATPGADSEPSVQAEPAAEETKAATAHEAEFEGLVDEVEKSLETATSGDSETSEPTAAAEPAASEPVAEPDAAAMDDIAALTAETTAGSSGDADAEPKSEAGESPLDSLGKGDEDLLAEFEKMLNS